jgi:hypothetical protein
MSTARCSYSPRLRFIDSGGISGGQRPRWATIAETADHLGVVPKTVRNHIGKGLYPGYRIPGTRGIRLNLNEVDRVMRSLPTSIARTGTPHYGPLTKIIDLPRPGMQNEADR